MDADSNGLVSAWRDVRGTGPGAVQLTPTSQPARIPDTGNGYPALRFAASWLQIEESITVGTLLVVARHEGTLFSRQEGLLSGPDSDASFYFTGKKTSSGTAPGWMADSSCYLKRRFRNGIESGATLAELDKPSVFSGVDSNTDLTRRTRSRLYLGRDRSYTANLWTGDILEVIIYANALADDKRIQVEQYLKSRYGII